MNGVCERERKIIDQKVEASDVGEMKPYLK